MYMLWPGNSVPENVAKKILNIFIAWRIQRYLLKFCLQWWKSEAVWVHRLGEYHHGLLGTIRKNTTDVYIEMRLDLKKNKNLHPEK